MQMIEANLNQRGSLPLPSATLVIDLRGTQDGVIERLNIEIADLASEMQLYEVHHWRRLTDLLHFREIEPLREEDVKELCKAQNAPQAPATPPATAQPAPQVGILGPVPPNRQQHAGFAPSFQNNQGDDSNATFDLFTQHIEEINLEIDRLRNNRNSALADLDKRAVKGQSNKDSTVRVIFLTDVGRPDSLASAAVYAARLKEIAAKRIRQGYPEWLSTTVLCLDNSVEVGPPSVLVERLRWNDSWAHLDTLVICEQYTTEASRIDGAIQAYIAELLLYLLLLVPPLNIGTSASSGGSSDMEVEQNGMKGHLVNLPSHTYTIGLAAMEHSTRWGRRMLNYGLVKDSVTLLQQNKPAEDDTERRSVRNIVGYWLRDFRGQLSRAVPEKVPGNFAALDAIPQAERTSNATDTVFSTSGFSPSLGERSLNDLRTYLSNLERTYIRSRTGTSGTLAQTSTADLTLQDAIDCIPQVEQYINQWDDKPVVVKMGTPVVKAQADAKRVLSHPNFFTSAAGAIPRARAQLRELATAISEFQTEHRQSTVDLRDRQNRLRTRGNDLINGFAQEAHRWPLLASIPWLKWTMAWFNVALILLFSVSAILLGTAWLHYAIVSHLSADALTLNSVLIGPTIPTFLLWGVVLLLILGVVFFFGAKLVSRRRTNLEVELTLWFSLVVFALAGLFVSYTVGQLVDDAVSLELLVIPSFLTSWYYVAFVFAFLILVVETFYLFWWSDHVRTERALIVEELHQQHLHDIEEVKRYISDDLALRMLRNAGLTDGKNGPGEYFSRIDQLGKRLDVVATKSQEQRTLAANRLALSLSETQQGAIPTAGGDWLNLYIRKELLDIEALAGGYYRQKRSLTGENEDLKELAELLVRIMSQETPAQIEDEFSERLVLSNKEYRQAHVLMSALVATTLRLSIQPEILDSMTPLLARYDDLNDPSVHEMQALNTLVQTFKRVNKQAIEAFMDTRGYKVNVWSANATAGRTDPNTMMATDAFANWEQMLWDQRDAGLMKALRQDGILPKLLEDGYDSHAVMRLLQAQINLFARPLPGGQVGELYLLMAPSQQGFQFRQSLNLQTRLVIDFPDVERLLFFYVQPYKSEAMFLPLPAPAQVAPALPPAPTQAAPAHPSAPAPGNGSSSRAGRKRQPAAGQQAQPVVPTSSPANQPAANGNQGAAQPNGSNPTP